MSCMHAFKDRYVAHFIALERETRECRWMDMVRLQCAASDQFVRNTMHSQTHTHRHTVSGSWVLWKRVQKYVTGLSIAAPLRAVSIPQSFEPSARTPCVLHQHCTLQTYCIRSRCFQKRTPPHPPQSIITRERCMCRRVFVAPSHCNSSVFRASQSSFCCTNFL